MQTADVSALNARFGIAGQLVFGAGPNGLVVAEIGNDQATASIVLQGAHLTHWAPRGQRPVIWLSRAAKFAPGKSIRGGVPVCWPWFGPHPTAPDLPAHGFARTVPWEIVETRAAPDGATRLVFRIIESDATRRLWPHPSTLELHLSVGAALELELVTRNADTAGITIGQALHTYFAVGDVRAVAIHGLDGCPYIDKVDGGGRKRQAGPVAVSGEVDRIYLDSAADCLIDDPAWGRRIGISKRGSRSTVVWNPWIDKAAKMGDLGENGYLDMICVESANAAADVVSIPPGGEHRLWVRYAVEP